MNAKTEKMKNAGNVSRSVARLAAVQALYELEMSNASPDAVLLEFVKHRWENQESDDGGELAEPDKELFLKIVRGVHADKTSLKKLLDNALSGEWTVDRLEVVLRVVLLSGLFELKALQDVPPKVVINEYMEVAKAFFDGGEVSMVNGVLDKMARLLREEEVARVSSSNGDEE